MIIEWLGNGLNFARSSLQKSVESYDSPEITSSWNFSQLLDPLAKVVLTIVCKTPQV